jgi:hypothetical protein
MQLGAEASALTDSDCLEAPITRPPCLDLAARGRGDAEW